MANSLHTTPFIITDKSSQNKFHAPFTKKTSRFPVNLKDGREQPRISPRKKLITVSAISDSPGIVSPSTSEDTPNLLNKVNVFDLDGRAILISDLWKDRRAVVAFARHFGCVFCRKRADYLASVKDKFDAAGVALILIGPGKVEQSVIESNRKSVIESNRKSVKRCLYKGHPHM
ncbi:hypothetical protein ACHQM5_008694 [Ranunculus cassubicifolius]